MIQPSFNYGVDADKHTKKMVQWENYTATCSFKVGNMTRIFHQKEWLQAKTMNKLYFFTCLFFQDFKTGVFQHWQMSIGGNRHSDNRNDERGSLLMWSHNYTVGRLSHHHLHFESNSKEFLWQITFTTEFFGSLLGQLAPRPPNLSFTLYWLSFYAIKD